MDAQRRARFILLIALAIATAVPVFFIINFLAGAQ